ncbi:MAG: lysylphosphatidylglycerol synthase transmembrane domain-containing protein [Pseudomonadota bacterium]
MTTVALGLAALPLLVLVLGPAERGLARLAGPGRWGRLAAGTADSLAQLRQTFRRPRLAVIAVLCSLMIHGLAILAAWLMGRQIGLDAPLWQYLIVVPLVWIITMVPASVGGLGVREASFGALFGAFGAVPETGVALGALVSASSILGILLGGLLAAFLPRPEKATDPEPKP